MTLIDYAVTDDEQVFARQKEIYQHHLHMATLAMQWSSQPSADPFSDSKRSAEYPEDASYAFAGTHTQTWLKAKALREWQESQDEAAAGGAGTAEQDDDSLASGPLDGQSSAPATTVAERDWPRDGQGRAPPDGASGSSDALQGFIEEHSGLQDVAADVAPGSARAAGDTSGSGTAARAEAAAVFRRGGEVRKAKLGKTQFFREVCSTLRALGRPARTRPPRGVTRDGLIPDITVTAAAAGPRRAAMCLQLISTDQLIAVAPRGQVCCTPSEWIASLTPPGMAGAPPPTPRLGVLQPQRSRWAWCLEAQGGAAWIASALQRSTGMAVFMVLEADWVVWSAPERRIALEHCLDVGDSLMGDADAAYSG